MTSRDGARDRQLLFSVARDALISAFSFVLALKIRFEGDPIPANFVSSASQVVPGIISLLLLFGLWRGLYRSIPRYAGLKDLSRLAGVIAMTSAALLIVSEIYLKTYGTRPLPLSVSLMGMLLTFFGMGGVRIARRLSAGRNSRKGPSSGLERVLIVGAGDAGEHVARDMLRTGSRYQPVGFLDDDPAKIGGRIHGLPVLGSTEQAAEVVSATQADYVLVALPSAPSRVLQEVLRRVALPGLGVKVLPSLGELMGAQATSADIRDVDISDLIARSQVTVNMDQISRMVQAKTVLITGAGGSIGGQLARQALSFKPARLVLLDNDETDLYRVFQGLEALAESRRVDLSMVVADIRDVRRVEQVFDQHRPHLVVHAAAYKHVPVMELHPGEAVTTNVTGTRHLAQAAANCGVERFVLVSSDKAVNPISVMGATKRLAEMVLTECGGQTIFSSVRFGNVLASRGSVVPTFKRQIAEGGPITVTHPDATRYFMTIEEAVSLIWQAAALATGREIFVLEMGEPVRIMDLAVRMRSLLSNGHADRIDIVVTGLRPGERLHEDLWTDGESCAPVRPGILRADLGWVSAADLSAIHTLEQWAAEHRDPAEVTAALFAIVGTRGDQSSV